MIQPGWRRGVEVDFLNQLRGVTSAFPSRIWQDEKGIPNAKMAIFHELLLIKSEVRIILQIWRVFIINIYWHQIF